MVAYREIEMQNMVVMCAAKCAKPLHAKFDNGIVYGFIPGECLTVSSVRDVTIGRFVQLNSYPQSYSNIVRLVTTLYV